MSKTIRDYSFKYTGTMDQGLQAMPIGNGDIAANVWLTKDGELHLLMSKTDAWSELYRLLKTAHVTLEMQPNLLEGGADFELNLADGILTIANDKAAVRVLADAKAPCLRVHVETKQEAEVKVKFHNYRSEPIQPGDDFSNYFMAGSDCSVMESADVLLKTTAGGFAQVHRNNDSCYEYSLKTQDMEHYIGREKDPLLGWSFGAAAYSTGMKQTDDGLATEKPVTEADVSLFSEAQFADSHEDFAKVLDALYEKHGELSDEGLKAHIADWNAFWETAYVYADGTDEARQVSRGFMYQRYMVRCADRGPASIKFNGSLFIAKEMEGRPGNYDARNWGAPYWIQNTRLLYWYMLQVGDYASMKSWFDICLKCMPISVERVKTYFGHRGMLLPETFSFFGLYANQNYGFKDEKTGLRKGNGGSARMRGEPANRYLRFHFEGMLEIAWTMVEYMRLSGDLSRREEMLEFCKNVLLFFNDHFDKLDGRLVMYPVSSMETWQVCVNDAPDIAGLHVLCDALAAMDDLPESVKDALDEIMPALPDLPIEMINGRRHLAPCETIIDQATRNVENPELYAVFPFPIYGLGKPDLELARDAYFRRRNRHDGGWSQDPMQAALLGLDKEARRHVVRQSGMFDKRAIFPAFWGPNFDETPDQDHGSNLCMGIMYMLLQCSGDSYTAFPCWPEEWDVSFRLPVCAGRYVRGEQVGGERRVWEETV